MLKAYFKSKTQKLRKSYRELKKDFRVFWLKSSLRLLKRKKYQTEDITEYLVHYPQTAAPTWIDFKPKRTMQILDTRISENEWFFEHAYRFPEIAIRYFIELHKDNHDSQFNAKKLY